MSASYTNPQAELGDSNTYQYLRNDPIKYGEEVWRLQAEGLSQKQIAEAHSCHYQMVGRYQKIGKWPDEIKALIRLHRTKFTNTKILSLASRRLSEEELSAEIKSMIGGQGDGVKTFPTVNGFNELVLKHEAIEQRLMALESILLKIEERQIEPKVLEEKPTHNQSNSLDRTAPSHLEGGTHAAIEQRLMALESNLLVPVERQGWPIASEEKPIHNQSTHLDWSTLWHLSTTPGMVLLMICITALTSYLVYQGIIFFSAIDSNPLSAISSAAFSEFIPMITACCFAMLTKNTHRVIAFTMLMTSIVGLGVFMHGSLATHMIQSSGRFERLTKARELVLASIAAHSDSFNALPKTHISRREDIDAKIIADRESLAKIDDELKSMESSGDGFAKTTNLGYSVWIRVAAMLLNAYLLHIFFSAFYLRRREVG